MKFHYAKHKSLWNWLARNPEYSKSFWPEWLKYKAIDVPIQYCFACEFAALYSVKRPPRFSSLSPRALCLKYCPIDWGKGCTCLQLKGNEYGSGLYHLWENEKTDLKLRANYARQIEKLPLKPWAEDYV